uniref:Myb/SANT-like DNA-binding domain-containing protein n=1 Tax=Knipowitschia caucasica TaxID=637954 RepID=A0AAV2JV18_KNICA
MEAPAAAPPVPTVVKWTKEMTETFIRVRAENDVLFTGAKFSASTAWRTVLEKLDLQEVVTPLQARKKWDNLKKKYKDCKCPGTGQGVEGNPTAGTWPWFGIMDEVLGQKPSINPPVLIASIPDARPGPSQAREQEPEQEEEEPEAEQQRGTGRKRKRESELVKLYREDLRMQREEDERRAQERSANFDRLFCLLEKMIENKNK